MKLVVYRVQPAGDVAQRTAAPMPGVGRLRFGDEVVVYGDGVRWDELRADVARTATSSREVPAELPPQRLHLVVQKGRLFQKEFPEVPVLLDRGRYLLVDLDAERARGLKRQAPCFRVLPVEGDCVVFEVRPRTAEAARAAPVPAIRALIEGITRADLEADLTKFVSFPTRHSLSGRFAEAAAWAGERLGGMGYRVHSQTVPLPGGASRNVIAEKAGSGPAPRDVVLVTAHLDSVNHGGGPTAPAPGADDNGSGSAGVLQIARALRFHPTRHDLRLILFGGEEQGLFGSLHHVAGLSAAERSRARAVVNMDMIAGRNTSDATVLLEGAALSRGVIDGLAAAAETYTGLTVETSLSPFNSDHVPFIDRGIPAVLTIEGADSANGNIHSGDDTIAHVDYELALEILRMNAAFAADTLGSVE